MTTMEKFHWMKSLCICAIHFLFWYCSNVAAADVPDKAIHLNISDAYLDVKINDTVYIKCSGPPPLSWTHYHPLNFDFVDGVEKNETSYGNESIIRLTFLSQDGTGEYACENEDSGSSVYIFVNGDKLLMADIKELLHPGVINYIPCFPTISDANMTLWKIDGPRREEIQLEFDPTRGFIVYTVTPKFNGQFECEAEYEGRNESRKLKLSTIEPTTSIPQVYIDGNNATYVMVGSDFSLECIIQTENSAKYSKEWKYPGKSNKRGKTTRTPAVKYRNEKNETFTLHILNATKDDEGYYRCSVTDHSERTNFAEVYVTVYVTPPKTTLSFHQEKEEIIKSRNENVKLIADYTVFPPLSNIPIVWKKDGRLIEHTFRHVPQKSNSAFSLEISNLNGNDSGLYTVTANVSSEFVRKSFLLRVQDTPIVDVSMNSLNFYPPGQNCTLHCNIIGYPTPVITWSWKPFCFNITPQCNSSGEEEIWQEFFEDYLLVNNSTVLMVNQSENIVSSISVVANESGYYKCNAANRFGASEKEIIFIVSDAKDGFEIVCENTNPEVYTYFFATCKASLIFYSDLRWKWISEFENQSLIVSTNNTEYSATSISLQLEFENISKNESGTYVCIATVRKSGNTKEKTIIVKVRDAALPIINKKSSSEMLVLIPSILGAFLLMLVVAYVIKILYFEQKNKFVLRDINHHLGQERMAFFDSNLPLDEQVDLLPYDENWEFPRENLKLGRVIGQGAFGRVIKAEAFGINDHEPSTTVAVKMLKERTDVNQQKSLMDELKILIHLGHHVNIVNLVGAVTKNIQKDGLMVIVEYCRHGNLRHYLHRHRDSFINEIDTETGRMCPTSDVLFLENDSLIHDLNSDFRHGSTSSSSGVFSVHNPNYRQGRGKNTICSNPRGSVSCQTAQTSCTGSTSSGSVSRSYYRTDSQEHAITTSDLLCYAFQCARGMDYLASRKLIHRDLAARNVLLADDKIVKICDFGLAKDCYKYSNYIKKGEGPLPIKWMSIESLWDHIFTSKSDVWSFGILMWEFFTLGGNPYPGVDINEQFYKKLKAGYRMEKPELCPDFAYQIMRECWNADPEKRPDFNQISDMIGDYLEENVKQHYIDVNEPYMEMNRKLKSPQYSNVERLECDDVQNPYVNSKVQDASQPYDVPGVCRSIYNEPFPAEPMEVVPMIQLDLYSETNEPSNINKTTELLQMNATNLLDYLQMEHSDEVP